MNIHTHHLPATLQFGLLLVVPLTCAAAADSTASQPATELSVTRGVVGPEMQQAISQVLWGCFVVGANLVGRGDVQDSKVMLRRCFTDDFTSEAIMPPAYASLGFSTSGGADGWVDTANQVYRGLNIARAQHLITDVVIQPNGPNSALVTSDALAVHVYPDEHVFNATVTFKDDFRRVNGTWMIAHRTMTVISASQAAAWTP